MSFPIVGTIRPTPTDEEAAALAAALEVLWPQPMSLNDDPSRSNWRFSGRWWNETTSWSHRSY
ncbi:MAG: hypothetical protein QF637_09625 [Acidimicrobiales bacterium]|nr:hypothetical protein [Acidimicrobiales bacterium]